MTIKENETPAEENVDEIEPVTDETAEIETEEPIEEFSDAERLVHAIIDKKPAEVMDVFNAAVKNRIADLLDDRKLEIAASFGRSDEPQEDE